mmetsp:Transcript_10866/g.22992  ORF Transcript_10866/g.22992 Transcript_10866/m.22992 type:complete len:421 (-) Transcript_10866:24-1286(-)
MKKSSIHAPSFKMVSLMMFLGLYVIVATGIIGRLIKRTSKPVVGGQLSDTPKLNEMILRNEKISDSRETNPSAIASSKQTIKATIYSCNTQNATDDLPGYHYLTKRALHGVIIGAMKGGTQALHKILLGHPKVLSTGMKHGEWHFFNRPNLGNSAYNIPRQNIRDEFETILRNREGFRPVNDIVRDGNNDKFGIHSAPIYLFSGRMVPARILCVAPWAKFLAILRNPIDRALSHYNFVKVWTGKRYDGVRPSFVQYVKDDIQLLKKAGVLRDWTSTDFVKFAGSPEEFRSWENYLRLANFHGPVGRGLYAIQLEIWADEFRKFGKSFKENILVLRSEESKENARYAYERATEFFGLEPQTIHNHTLEKDHHPTIYNHPDIPDDIYNELYELYRPYNGRLYKLLGEDEWAGVWDDGEIESR